MTTGATTDPETPLPLGALDPATTPQASSDAQAGTVPLPLDVGGFQSAVTYPGSEAAAGTVPLPLDLTELPTAVAQPGGGISEAAAGTVPVPVDLFGVETELAQPGGDAGAPAVAGMEPLPLDVTGLESTGTQPGGDATVGTVPRPVDETSSVRPARKRSKSQKTTGRTRSTRS